MFVPHNNQGGQHMTTIQDWAEPYVRPLLKPDESVELAEVGRLEPVPPSGLLAVLYWISYIATNYAAVLVTAFFRNRAAIVVTQNRLLVVSERTWKFPLWVITCSQRSSVDVMHLEEVASISLVQSRFLWVFHANGIVIESVSGSSRIINGLRKGGLEAARDYLRARNQG